MGSRWLQIFNRSVSPHEQGGDCSFLGGQNRIHWQENFVNVSSVHCCLPHEHVLLWGCLFLGLIRQIITCNFHGHFWDRYAWIHANTLSTIFRQKYISAARIKVFSWLSLGISHRQHTVPSFVNKPFYLERERVFTDCVEFKICGGKYPDVKTVIETAIVDNDLPMSCLPFIWSWCTWNWECLCVFEHPHLLCGCVGPQSFFLHLHFVSIFYILCLAVCH